MLLCMALQTGLTSKKACFHCCIIVLSCPIDCLHLPSEHLWWPHLKPLCSKGNFSAMTLSMAVFKAGKFVPGNVM